MILFIIRGLMACIRPLLGPPGVCRFELPCTDYASMTLKDFPLHKALFRIARRVLRCSPLSVLTNK